MEEKIVEAVGKGKNGKKAMGRIYVLLAVYGLIFLFVIGGIFKYIYDSRFHQARWLENPDGRLVMARSMLSEYPLEGKTPGEIVTLLGPETDLPEYGEREELIYYLGQAKTLFTREDRWLVVTFSGGLAETAVIGGVDVLPGMEGSPTLSP